MNDQGDTDRTAALLKDALSAAADVMVLEGAAAPQRVKPVRRLRRTSGRLAPLAAAASVAVIALGTLIGAHLASPAGPHPAAGQGAAQHPARPEFYLTVTYPASGHNALQFQVRRTSGGAVTASRTIPAANVGWGGYLTAAAGDRAFYFARYLCTTAAAPRTTFDRITITNAGRISGFAPAARPVQGMVTSFAVSPDGSQMAYNALPGVCTGDGFRSAAAASVSVEDLSTGAVRTWQDVAAGTVVSRLSWATAGRTLIVDEAPRGLRRLALTVFALDTTSGGGSLQAHSSTLLKQNATCSTCVATALAGPGGSLTELESQPAGQRTRVLVLSLPSAAGSPRTVLYSKLTDAPRNKAVDDTDLFADPSGQWPLLWPTTDTQLRADQDLVPAGWISGGRLHPLPGAAQIFPQGIAW